MIVVVGTPSWGGLRRPQPSGLAAAVALASSAHGARVELVGRVGDDDAGDALLIALAQGGVGHVAMLRDPARATVIRPGVAALEEPPLDAIDADSTAAILEDEGGLPVDPARLDDRAPVLEAADVAMGLRYLTEFSVLVVVDVPDAAVAVAVEAARYAEAALVVLVGPGSPVPDGLPPDATVLAVPAVDPADRFAQLVADYAAGLDQGRAPADAFTAAAAASGWEGAAP